MRVITRCFLSMSQLEPETSQVLANNRRCIGTSTTVMQWRLGVTRRIQALLFLLSRRLDTSRHSLVNFLVISGHIWHLNFTDCFGGGFALDFKNDLHCKLSPNSFSFPIIYFTLGHISHLQMLYITNVSSEEEQALFNLPLHTLLLYDHKCHINSI